MKGIDIVGFGLTIHFCYNSNVVPDRRCSIAIVVYTQSSSSSSWLSLSFVVVGSALIDVTLDDYISRPETLPATIYGPSEFVVAFYNQSLYVLLTTRFPDVLRENSDLVPLVPFNHKSLPVPKQFPRIKWPILYVSIFNKYNWDEATLFLIQ